jgi:hypothetical protein
MLSLRSYDPSSSLYSDSSLITLRSLARVCEVLLQRVLATASNCKLCITHALHFTVHIQPSSK